VGVGKFDYFLRLFAYSISFFIFSSASCIFSGLFFSVWYALSMLSEESFGLFAVHLNWLERVVLSAVPLGRSFWRLVWSRLLIRVAPARL